MMDACVDIPKTGDTCDRAGLYESACDRGHFKHYKRGDMFQACGPCDLGVNWFPVKGSKVK